MAEFSPKFKEALSLVQKPGINNVWQRAGQRV